MCEELKPLVCLRTYLFKSKSHGDLHTVRQIEQDNIDINFHWIVDNGIGDGKYFNSINFTKNI